MFVTALGTSGNTKDAKFIADFIIKIIEDKGPANIVAVCMDGACTASFPLIIYSGGKAQPSPSDRHCNASTRASLLRKRFQ